MPQGKPKDGSKNPGGRPKKYTQAFLDNLADELLEWFQADESRYFWNEWCVKQGFHPNRIAEFAEISKKFSGVYKSIKAIQEERLSSRALNNKANTTMAIFALKNHHGWTDKKEIEHSGGIENTEKVDLSNVDADKLQRLADLAKRIK